MFTFIVPRRDVAALLLALSDRLVEDHRTEWARLVAQGPQLGGTVASTRGPVSCWRYYAWPFGPERYSPSTPAACCVDLLVEADDAVREYLRRRWYPPRSEEETVVAGRGPVGMDLDVAVGEAFAIIEAHAVGKAEARAFLRSAAIQQTFANVQESVPTSTLVFDVDVGPHVWRGRWEDRGRWERGPFPSVEDYLSESPLTGDVDGYCADTLAAIELGALDAPLALDVTGSPDDVERLHEALGVIVREGPWERTCPDDWLYAEFPRDTLQPVGPPDVMDALVNAVAASMVRVVMDGDRIQYWPQEWFGSSVPLRQFVRMFGLRVTHDSFVELRQERGCPQLPEVDFEPAPGSPPGDSG